MTIRIITDDNNRVAVFKSHDDAVEYIMNSKNILKAKKTKGLVEMTETEYGKYLNK